MSVNIFGSSAGKSSAKLDTKYVDRKFMTLSINLNTKVNKGGDTLTGDFDFGENKIMSSYIPLTENDLVNKRYVDTLVNTNIPATVVQLSTDVSSKVNKSGDTMTGDLILGSNKIKTTSIPISDDDVINKKHFDELIARRLGDNDLIHIENKLNLKLNKSGDNMSGNINMGSNKITSRHLAVSANDLINKKYITQVIRVCI